MTPGPVAMWGMCSLLLFLFVAIDPHPPGEIARAIVVGSLLLGAVVAYGCQAIVKAIKEARS